MRSTIERIDRSVVRRPNSTVCKKVVTVIDAGNRRISIDRLQRANGDLMTVKIDPHRSPESDSILSIPAANSAGPTADPVV